MSYIFLQGFFYRRKCKAVSGLRKAYTVGQIRAKIKKVVAHQKTLLLGLFKTKLVKYSTRKAS